MRIVYSFTTHLTKLALILLFVGFWPVQWCMAMQIVGSDGKSFQISREDAKNFAVLQEIIKENGHANIIIVNSTQFNAETLGSLFQLVAGMPVQHLSSKSEANSFNAIHVWQGPKFLVENLEKELWHRSFTAWYNRNYGAAPLNESQMSSLSLVDVQKKSKRGKINLSSKHLETLRGCVLNSSQMKKIKEIDLSFNQLTLAGADAMQPFQLFRQLAKLNLANNQLERIPAHFFASMPNCEVISLANNQIHTIEDHAFADAHNCIVNICGNRLETIQPNAMTGGQRKLVILCSLRNSIDVINAIRNQLGATDTTYKLLTKCFSFAQKVSSFNGCTPWITVFGFATACTLILLPVFWVNQIDSASPKALSIASAYTFISLATWYNLLRMIQRLCANAIDGRKNLLTLLDRQVAQQQQREMFAS